MNKRYLHLLLFAVATGIAGYEVNALVPKPRLPARPALSISYRAAVPGNLAAPATLPPGRAGLARYRQSIQDSLFSAPPSKIPEKPAPVRRAAASTPTSPAPRPAPADPLVDAVYSGSFTVDGKTTALIESRSTGEGVYIAKGEQWQGWRITEVSPSEVAFSINGDIRRLPKSEAFNTLPLNASAPGSGSTPTTSAPNGINLQAMSMAPQPERMTTESGMAVDYMRIREEQNIQIQELKAAQDTLSLQEKL